jgi:hypothetical protein
MFCQLCNNFDAIGECQVCHKDVCSYCDKSDNKEETTICEDCMAARKESRVFKVVAAATLGVEVMMHPERFGL